MLLMHFCELSCNYAVALEVHGARDASAHVLATQGAQAEATQENGMCLTQLALPALP
jgi:hypothetical protein